MLRIAFGLALLFGVASAATVPATPVVPPAAAKAATPPAQSKRTRSLPIDGVPALTRIDAKGILRVGFALNAPWVLHDKNGALVGYSVDVARKLATDMGWKLELVATSWPLLLDNLRANEYDVVISGLSITPQRARLAAFTQPYGEYDISLVVNRDKISAGDVAALSKSAHQKIAVRKGTLVAEFARAALPDADFVEVDDEVQAIADLRAGKFDGFAAEQPLPGVLEQLYPEKLHVLPGALARTAHGMAVRRGDRDLRDVLDAWIVQAKASGWLKSRGDYWFNGLDWVGQL